MPTPEELEGYRARRQAIRDGVKDTEPLTPEEEKELDMDDLDNPKVQEAILNPKEIPYVCEDEETKLTMHKLSASMTRKFHGFASTVAASTMANERAISGRVTFDNFITGLHVKGLLVQSDVLHEELIKYIAYSSVPTGTMSDKELPKIMAELDEKLSMEDVFNLYAILTSLTGAMRSKRVLTKNVLAPAP